MSPSRQVFNKKCSILKYGRDQNGGNNMTTTQFAKAQEVERKWYVIDAAGVSLGRVAAEAARLLRG
jgi:hypothetical protein